MPQPLPANPYDPNADACLYEGYTQCVLMESEAGGNRETLMLARCLGYLIKELPHDAGELVAIEVVECHADIYDMSLLAHFYIDHLIRLFRQNKGKTPAPSEHPSRPSFELHSGFYSEAVDPAPRSHNAAKKSALRRDGYRCVVSGCVDNTSYMSMDAAGLQAYNLNQNPVSSTATNFCHIFPPSTNWGFNPNDPAEKKKKYSGNVWAIIDTFKSIDILVELDGSNIHRLENGFTLDVSLHNSFDNLRLWFEHIANDTYRMRTLDPSLMVLQNLPANPYVTFTSTDPSLPLPNPEYLKLHAAVCRVAHMCGAADYLDQEDRDIDRRKVLSRDGTSANLLASRLKYVSLRA